MILLLAPGPQQVGPTPVQAAIAPAEPSAVNLFDAAGNGIGCQAGTRKYKGPGLPKDPPWPPGAKPTPSPEPSPTVLPTASPPEPIATPEPGASPEPDAAAAMAFLAADVDIREEEPPVEPPRKVRKSKLMKGLDVSHWQEKVNYDVAKNAGNRFVFIKATESREFVDSWFPASIAAARSAGLAVGAYHVFDYTLDGKDQADHFIDRLEAAGGIDRALPPVIDVECWDYRGSSTHAVSATRLRDLANRIYERTGRLPAIYTSAYMWSQVVGDADGLEDLPLWAACWRCDVPPTLPAGWDDWTFWQIGQFRIKGAAPDAVAPDRLDGNYFSGKRKDLEALKLRPFRIASGAPVTAGGTVELDLGGRDATHLRSSPDGDTWSEWSRIGSTPTARIPKDEGEHLLYVELRNGDGLRAPVVSDSIFVDSTPPELTTPGVSLRLGLLEGGAVDVPITVEWNAQDTHAGLADASVSVACDEGPERRSEAPGSAAPGEQVAWSAAAAISANTVCEVTAIAQDGGGNRERATSEPISSAIVEFGADAPLSADVEGHQVGVIAQRGPDAGRATIVIDGQADGLVDLYAPVSSGPEVVYIVDLDAAVGHRLSVEPTGTADPASLGTDIVVDGVVSLSAAS